MGIIVGSSEVYLQCDYLSTICVCRTRSEKRHTQAEAVKNAGNHGWRYSHSDGKCYCPEHAYTSR